MSPNRTLLQNIRWGIGNGALFAAVLSVMMAVVELARGAISGSQVLFVTGVYFASGISAGFVVGLLRRWTHRRIGAAAVGTIAAVPVGVALELAYDSISQQPFSWLMLVEFAVIAGPLGGMIRWNQTWGRATAAGDPGRTTEG
jgi:hypothetical protein